MKLYQEMQLRDTQFTSNDILSDGSFTLVMIKVPHALAISIISEPIQDPLGHLLSGHPPFLSAHQAQ